MQGGEWNECGRSQPTVSCTEGREGVVRLVVSDDAETTSAMKTEKHFLNVVITGCPNKS